jgi:hypothetical protein
LQAQSFVIGERIGVMGLPTLYQAGF